MDYHYPRLVTATLKHLLGERAVIDDAVDLIAERLMDGGVLHVFGTGHARIPMHEMAGRAGGLMSVNLVRLSDLAFYGDRSPSELADPLLERDPAYAAPLFTQLSPGEQDAVLIASNSGINGVVVEFAMLAKAAGLPVIALTSLQHSGSVPSRHPSGARLMDLADLVIDNGAPPGDAALDLGDGIVVGAVSNLAGVIVVQLLTEGVARRFIEAGRLPAVYRSMNLPDGDERNTAWMATVTDRVRPIEP